jgi:hypothetical protein
MSGYRLGPSVLRAEVGADEVLLNPDTGVYHLVNGSGREVLTRLCAGEAADAVAADIAAREGVAPAAVTADVTSFVADLTARGLLEPA